MAQALDLVFCLAALARDLVPALSKMDLQRAAA
jgi:hypothetical protein